jgi:HNH endonuclease
MPNPFVPRPVFYCQCGDHAWTALTRGYVTFVSPQDAHFLKYRAWCAKPARRTFYATCGKGARLHRWILETNSAVDHRNGNGLDNRRRNLREATNQQNVQNGRAHKDSTSKYRGVSWYAPYKKWRAAIYINGRQKCIGYFNNEQTAAHSYDVWAEAEFGEFAALNFP